MSIHFAYVSKATSFFLSQTAEVTVYNDVNNQEYLFLTVTRPSYNYSRLY